MTAPIVTAEVLVSVTVLAIVFSLREWKLLNDQIGHAEFWSTSQTTTLVSRVYRTILVLSKSGNYVSVADIVDAAVEDSASKLLGVVRYIGAGAVYGGLLGALLGLQGAVQELSGVRRVTTQQEMESFFSAAAGMLNSFGSAFSAAIAGVICTLIVNALVAAIENKQETFRSVLETVVREKMLPKMPAGDEAGKALETLSEASQCLAETLTAADVAFASSVDHLRLVATAAHDVLEQGRASLASVRDDFLVARDGLSDALALGATALGDATDRASVEIGRAAAAATDRLRVEVETVNAGRSAMESGVLTMAETLDRLLVVLGAVESTVNGAQAIESSLVSSQQALTDLAASQRELGNNVHRSLVQSQLPMVEGINRQVEVMRKPFEDFEATLASHRAFVLDLGDAVRDLPNSIRNEELALVGSARLDQHMDALVLLVQQVEDVRREAATASASTSVRVDDLADKVADLLSQTRTAASKAPSDKNDIAILATEVQHLSRGIDLIRTELERRRGISALLGRGRK